MPCFLEQSKKLNDTCIILLPAKFYGNILVDKGGGGGGGGYFLNKGTKEHEFESEDNLCKIDPQKQNFPYFL